MCIIYMFIILLLYKIVIFFIYNLLEKVEWPGIMERDPEASS